MVQILPEPMDLVPDLICSLALSSGQIFSCGRLRTGHSQASALHPTNQQRVHLCTHHAPTHGLRYDNGCHLEKVEVRSIGKDILQRIIKSNVRNSSSFKLSGEIIPSITIAFFFTRGLFKGFFALIEGEVSDTDRTQAIQIWDPRK